MQRERDQSLRDLEQAYRILLNDLMRTKSPKRISISDCILIRDEQDESFVDAIIGVKGNFDPSGELKLKKDVEEYYRKILRIGGMTLHSLKWVTRNPTPIWFLRFIKINQPVKLGQITDSVNQDFKDTEITEKWVNHQLDSLRKKGFIARIVRDDQGYYVVTLKALDLIPAGVSYTSSDINRVFALRESK